MILSTSHNFLFVHVPKTAGTAMASALEPFAVRGTRTGLRRTLRWLPLREAPERAYFRKHETAAAMRFKLGPQVFDRFVRFTVVRNPFEHAVSHYEYLKEFRNPRKAAEFAAMSFDEYLHWRTIARGPFVPSFSVLPDQTHWLVDRKGRLLVDRVLRFENLAADFDSLIEVIGLSSIRMHRINPTKAKAEGRSLASYYDSVTADQVRELYARDFRNFGYSLEMPQGEPFAIQTS